MSDMDELREFVMSDDEPFGDYREGMVQQNEVSEGKIFGLTAGERMILSIILFMAVTVLSIAILLATNTVVLR